MWSAWCLEDERLNRMRQAADFRGVAVQPEVIRNLLSLLFITTTDTFPSGLTNAVESSWLLLG